MAPCLLFLLVLAAPVAALTLREAQESVQLAIQIHTTAANDGGRWEVAVRKGAKPKLMRLLAVEKGTIHQVKRTMFSALATTRENATSEVLYAVFAVELGEDDWKVTSIEWVPQAKVAALRRRFTALASDQSKKKDLTPPIRTAAAPTPLPAASEERGLGAHLPDIELPKLDPGPLEAIDSCEAKKCLTIYLAHWSPACKSATTRILQLRDHLKKSGIPTRIIVGLSSDGEAVIDFARHFGPDTLLDMRNEARVSEVPHFYVTKRGGELLVDKTGSPPKSDEPAVFAAMLRLP